MTQESLVDAGSRNTGGLSVGAVVVTRNRWSLLQKSLESLQRQTIPLSDVIVIDNAGNDGTREGIREHFPWVSYVRLENNVGGAGGFSEGIRIGYEKGYDWLWVMDDDALPEPDALARMLETQVIRKADTGILYCLVVDTDGELDPRSRAHWIDMRTFRTTAIFNGTMPAEEAIECNLATFVGLLVNRTAVARIGFPRSDFFIGYDDVEYIHRICAAGFKAYQIPKSKIVHLNAGMNRSAGKPARHSRQSLTPAVWRSYYDWRNSMFLMLQYSDRLTFLRKAGRFAVGTILFRDHKLRRLRVLAQAIGDARAGRLGQRTFPQE